MIRLLRSPASDADMRLFVRFLSMTERPQFALGGGLYGAEPEVQKESTGQAPASHPVPNPQPCAIPEDQGIERTHPLALCAKGRRAGKLRDAGFAILWPGLLTLAAWAFFNLLEPGTRVCPPPFTADSEAARVRKVAIVVLDAWRADVAFDPDVMPFVCSLRQRGAWGYHKTGPFPVSASFYKAFLSGRRATISDVYNDLSPTPRRIPTWLHHVGLPCFFSGPASGFAWVANRAEADYVWVLERMEDIPGHDRRVLDAAHQRIARVDRGIFFCHLAALDAVAHRDGATGPMYREAARALDDAVRGLARELDLTQDLLMVLSDHGVRDDGGHSSGTEEAVVCAPFVACGPGFRPGVRVALDQSAWPLVMAAILGGSTPEGYAGVPSVELLEGTAALRAERLIRDYRDYVTASMPTNGVLAALWRPPLHGPGKEATGLNEILKAHRELAESRARAVWWACSLALFGATIVTLRRGPGFGSASRWWLAGAIALPCGVWLLLEWLGAGSGPLDGTFADGLPELRFHAVRDAPLAAVALCVLCTAAVLTLKKLPRPVAAVATVALFASLLGLQRNRMDLVLYGAIGTAIWLFFAEGRTGLRAGPVTAPAVFVLVVAVAAAGQKLSYNPLLAAGFNWACFVAFLLYVVLGVTAFRNGQPFLVCSVLLGMGAALSRGLVSDWFALVTWGLCLILPGVAMLWRVPFVLFASGGAVGVAPLILAWPQTWAVLVVALVVTVLHSSGGQAREQDPAATLCEDDLRAVALALATALALFFFGGGRDSYLPVNEFYRTAVGVEVGGIGLSMWRGAVAVATRYVLYVCCGAALALALIPRAEVRLVVYGIVGVTAIRLVANCLAFAVFGKHAWNYHLALLFNDACFLAAGSLIMCWMGLRSAAASSRVELNAAVCAASGGGRRR